MDKITTQTIVEKTVYKTSDGKLPNFPRAWAAYFLPEKYLPRANPKLMHVIEKLITPIRS